MHHAADNCTTIKILVVDRYPLVRRGIRAICRQQPDLQVCGEANDATTALELVERLSPDVAIVEAAIRDEAGQSLLERMNLRCASIGLSTDHLGDYCEFVRRCTVPVITGYADVIERLLVAVRTRALLRDQTPASSDCDACSSAAERAAHLTRREAEILGMLSRGLGSRRIAELLRVSQKTVETHREHLKRKFGIRSASELVAWSVHWAQQRERADRPSVARAVVRATAQFPDVALRAAALDATA